MGLPSRVAKIRFDRAGGRGWACESSPGGREGGGGVGVCQQLDFSPRLVIREVVYWIRRGRVAGLESLMTSVLSPRRWRGLVASHRRRRAGSAHSSYLVSDSAGQRGGRERVPPSPLPSSVDTAGHSCGLAHNGVGSVGLVQDTNADRLGLALAGRRWSLHRWLWSIRLTEAGGAPRGDGEVLARRCARDCCQPAATRGWPGGPACRRNDSWTGAVMSPEPPVVLPPTRRRTPKRDCR